MDTMNRQPINDDFNALLASEDEQPGPPFFDDTLNYLQGQFNKTNSDIGSATQKKFKLEDQIATMEAERETVKTLLIEEYRQRQPFDPETSERVSPPFDESEREDEA